MGSGHTKKLSKWMTKHGDVIVPVSDPRESDLVIPIMGPTGVGKSTFINTVYGRNVMTVGHDLQSCTSKIEHVIVPHPRDRNRRIVFVDTLGFDDTYVDDAQVLKLIAVWLARSYSDGMKLSGIVYLHEISQTRMFGTSRKTLTMFNKLCGDDALKNVILATTKWSGIDDEVGQRRELQLCDTYWKPMLAQGSRMARFTYTRESAWDIVNLIICRDVVDGNVLIQRELVDLQVTLPETQAGRALRYTLEELLELQRDMARQLREENGAQGSEELRRRQEELSQQLRSTLHQIQELKVPFSKRILSFLFPSKKSRA